MAQRAAIPRYLLRSRIPAGDLAKAVFGLGTFFSIDQMPVLIGYGFCAVLDLLNLAGDRAGIVHGHIKFTGRKLQLEDSLWGTGQLRFQRDDNLHYSAFNLALMALAMYSPALLPVTMRFLENGEHVAFPGPPEVGRTHLASAVLLRRKLL